MGQALGLPSPVEGAKPFTNLPREALESLWTSYNLNGEGWGLDLSDLKRIFTGATHIEKNVGLNDVNMAALFDAFDTDFNNLIDALETLTALAIISGMDIVDKVYYVFSLYDFEGSGRLSFDAVTLVLRSAVKGLSKVCPSQATLANALDQVESFVELLFRSVGRPVSESVSAVEFQTYCAGHPVISSWLKFFSSIPFTEDTSTSAAKGISEEDVVDLFPPLPPPIEPTVLRSLRRAVKPVEEAASASETDFNEEHKPAVRSLPGGPKELPPEVLAAKEAAAKAADDAAAAETAKIDAEQPKDPTGDDGAQEGKDTGEEKDENKEGADEEGEKAEGEGEEDEGKNEEEEGEGEAPEPEDVEEEGEVGGEEEEDDGKKKKIKVIKLPMPNPFQPVPSDLPQELPWFQKVDLMKPEDFGIGPFRVDKPEDTIEPSWIYGLGTSGSVLRRFVHYNAADCIIYPVSRTAVSLKMQIDESGSPMGWMQSHMMEHRFPITCCDVDSTGRFLATADCIPSTGIDSIGSIDGTLPGSSPATVAVTSESVATAGTIETDLSPRIVIWDTKDLSVVTMFFVDAGVRRVDFSPTGRKILALLADAENTVIIYDITSKTIVFSAPMTPLPMTEGTKVTDCRFCGTDAMFVVVGTEGTVFYIEEGSGFFGPDSMKTYQRRKGLLQAVGHDAVGVTTTAVSRLQQPDESVVGTALGQVLLWRGRSCTQLLAAHTAAVTAFSYSSAAGILASGAKDNKIKISKIVDPSAASVNAAQRREPRLLHDRCLEVVATIDLLKLGPIDGRVSSICLHATAEKILVVTEGGELRELACALKLKGATADAPVSPAVGEGNEASMAPEGESEEVSTLRFGADVYNGPLAFGHWRNGKCASVTSVARIPGGFLTSGRDAAVSLWQASEGAPQTRLKKFQLIGGGADVGINLMAISPSFVAFAADAGTWKANPLDRGAQDGLSGSPLTGLVQLLALPELTPVSRLRYDLSNLDYPSKDKWLSDLKFSPDGNSVALVTADGYVSIYALVAGGAEPPPAADDAAAGGDGDEGSVSDALPVPQGPQFVLSMRFNASGATCVDYALDGMNMRSTDSTQQELHVWDLTGASAAAVVPPAGDDEEATGQASSNPVPSGPVELTNKETLRALTWASNSVPLAWDLKGVWNAQLKIATRVLEPITACDRSQHLFLSSRHEGAVMMSRIPAPLYTPTHLVSISNQQFFPAHCGRISSVQFIEEGTKLVTSGRDDGAVIVWKVNYELEEPTDPAAFKSLPRPPPTEAEDGEDLPPPEDEEPQDEEEEEPEEEEEEEELDEDGNPKPKMPVVYDSGDEEDLFDGMRMKIHLTLRQKQHAKYSAILPWAASVGRNDAFAIEAIARETSSTSLTPTDELQIHWVYGHSSRIPRASVKFSPDGHIVYPAGAFGITFDKLKRRQIHCMAHCDEITCLDVHIDAGVAATAHKGAGNIFVCVWQPSSGHILRRLNCGQVNGASAIAFSPDGKLLAVALQNESHDVLLFDWKNGHLRARAIGGLKKVLGLAFSLAPAPPPVEGVAPSPEISVFNAKSPFSPYAAHPEPKIPVRILQGGDGHFQLLELKSGRTMSSKVGSFGPDLKKVSALCVAALPVPEEGGSEFVIGLSNGSIGVIARGEKVVSNVIPVQKGAVTSLCVVKLLMEGEVPPEGEEDQLFKLVTGGVQGMIKVFDQNFEQLAEFNLYRVPELYGNLHQVGRVRGIKSLCVDKANRKLVYGTCGGEIGEIDLNTGKDMNDGPLVRSHFRDQLHVLVPHPIRQEILTAGDDKTMRIWDLETACQCTSTDLPDIPRCGCFSPNGHLIAIGLGGEVPGVNRPRPRPCNGQVVVYSYLQSILNFVVNISDAADTVTSVTFTLDGSKLIVASLDASIYVYNALDNFKLTNTLRKHSEGILTLDITSDGRHLVSMGSKSEMLVWDIMFWLPLPEKERLACLASTSWAIRQGTFGNDSMGVFPLYGNAEDVLTLAKSHDDRLLVTGDCQGLVYLRNYPARCPGAPSKTYQGHTVGGVAKVAFSLEDKYLLSIGRDDRVIIQWSVKRHDNKPEEPAPVLKLQPAIVAHRDTGHDQIFDNSFDIHGVKFIASAKAQTRAAAAMEGQLPQVKLSTVLGVGNAMTACLAARNSAKAPRRLLPVADYCAGGDIVTVHGRTVTTIAGGDRFTQRHWTHLSEATEEIGLIAVSSCSRYVLVARTHASEPGAPSPFTHSLGVFGGASGQLLCELSADLPGEVSSLAFSRDGRTVACLCRDAHHSLCVFTTAKGDWTDTIMVYNGNVSEADIAVVAFLTTNRPPYSSFSGPVEKPLPTVSPEKPAPEKEPKKKLQSKKAKEKETKEKEEKEKAAKLKAEADGANKTASAEEKSGSVAGDEVKGNDALKSGADDLALSLGTYDLITGGAGHLRFWRIYGRNVTSVSADYGDSKLPSVTAVCGLTDLPHAITGDVTGAIWQWVGHSRGNRIGNHDGPIMALKGFKALWGCGLVSAASDSLKLWDSSTLGCLKEFHLPSIFSAVGLDRIIPKNITPAVTSLTSDAMCNRLMFTLSTGALLEIAVDSGSAAVLAEGLSNRLSAFAAHPKEPFTIVTGDHDNLIKIWDISQAHRGVTAVVNLPRFASAFAFQGSTLVVAIASRDAVTAQGANQAEHISPVHIDSPGSSLLFLDLHPFKEELPRPITVLHKIHDVTSDGLVNCLRFSPNGNFLVVGCSDGSVQIYNAKENFSSGGSFNAHSVSNVPVVGLDFSADSRYIRTFGPCSAFDRPVEVHIFDMFPDNSDAQVVEVRDEAQLKILVNIVWASVSSVAASEARAAKVFPHPLAVDAAHQATLVTDISTHKFSNDLSLLAASYSDGTIRFFRSPACHAPNSPPLLTYSTHAKGAVRSVFTSNGQLCSVGVEDGTVMVWDVKI